MKCFSLKSACGCCMSRLLKEHLAIIVKKVFQLRKAFNLNKTLVWRQYCMHCFVFFSDEFLSTWLNRDVIIINWAINFCCTIIPVVVLDSVLLFTHKHLVFRQGNTSTCLWSLFFFLKLIIFYLLISLVFYVQLCMDTIADNYISYFWFILYIEVLKWKD